ncbi:hypothetical protein WN51_11197 [Melipona quadrifasciata]|uniref:Uncharacterized protein n=1 Tax=Melipona quadrifasciata TaxID=166423 RepID=A0A0M9A688_9HYME|nr:hypothetical protein WN51_11197 [Melipona quadrifasciata]
MKNKLDQTHGKKKHARPRILLHPLTFNSFQSALYFLGQNVTEVPVEISTNINVIVQRPRIPQIRVSNTRLAQAASGCAPSVDVLPISDRLTPNKNIRIMAPTLCIIQTKPCKKKQHDKKLHDLYSSTILTEKLRTNKINISHISKAILKVTASFWKLATEKPITKLQPINYSAEFLRTFETISVALMSREGLKDLLKKRKLTSEILNGGNGKSSRECEINK